MWQSEQKEKEAFAAEWLRQSDPFKAAVLVVGTHNAGRALRISSEWVMDPFVLTHKQKLIEEKGEESFLPSKAELARKVLEVHENARATEDKLKALRLYAEIMGHITKPETGANKGGPNLVAVPVNELDAKL